MIKAVGAVAVAISACGGLVETSTNATAPHDGGGGVAGLLGKDASKQETSIDDVALDEPDDASDGGPCTPEPWKWNCCNGETCRGTCEGDGCQCGALKGGCPAPLVCCATVCKAEGKC